MDGAASPGEQQGAPETVARVRPVGLRSMPAAPVLRAPDDFEIAGLVGSAHSIQSFWQYVS